MTGGTSGARWIGAVLLAGSLSACAGGLGGNREPPLENFTPEEIYKRGEFELENDRRPDQAIRYFSEVERLYPYSEWAKRALIMQAFANHQSGAYEEARAAAQRYLDSYPTDEDAPYAQYLLALQGMREVIELYPDSDYARSAMLKFDLAYDHLAGKEMEIGRYYLKGQHYAAAINRFRVVVEQYQTTTHTPEALMRLVESYLALGLTDEAQTAGAILGYNFRSSPFYDDAYLLLTGKGLSPQAQGNSWLNSVYRQVIRGEWL